MSASRAAWRWFGRRPAVAMVGALYALPLLVKLALGTSLAGAVGFALFVAFAVYCLARPRGGWDVYLAALFPGATAALFHGLIGLPLWLGVLLIPVALLIVWAEDRGDAAHFDATASRPAT